MSLEELNELVERLNNFLDGMSTAEKEEAVKDLIYNTGPRFIPGTRNLPFNLYAEDEEVPEKTKVDSSGLPIKDMKEEVIAVKPGKTMDRSKRPSGYQSLPSSTSRLSEPRTDSEKSVLPGKKRKGNKPGDKVRSDVHVALIVVVSINLTSFRVLPRSPRKVRLKWLRRRSHASRPMLKTKPWTMIKAIVTKTPRKVTSMDMTNRQYSNHQRKNKLCRTILLPTKFLLNRSLPWKILLLETNYRLSRRYLRQLKRLLRTALASTMHKSHLKQVPQDQSPLKHCRN